MKQALSQQKEQGDDTKKRVERLENCPCAVHRDPAHTCVVLDIKESLDGIRLENNEKLGAIQRRLAWWGGGLAVVIFLLELVSRVIPLIWR